NIFLMKTDFAGNILWSKQFLFMSDIHYVGSPSDKIHETSDGGYVLMAMKEIIKIDSAGSVLWAKELFLDDMGTNEAIETKDKGYMIAGNGPVMFSLRAPWNIPQIGLIKTDSLGNSSQCIYNLSINSTSSTLVSDAVSFSSVNAGMVMKMQPVINSTMLMVDSGCVSFIGSINEKANKSENAISIYPNPANSNITIGILQIAKENTIIINNVNGQELIKRQTTNDKLLIDVCNLPNGIYFIKVVNENGVSVGKFVKD
ncbi:MAG: T9SS type A sorting domain-containing protein, partial [Bacteroidales bacterium]|nr:T9SS type A sorting domain-containing protein [Bacteroidales bacterium]